MVKALLAAMVIFGILVGWVWVQQLYLAFSRHNPELGPFRAEGGGCGSGGCACGGGQCSRNESA